MKDVEIIGMLKSYINKTLVGMGALKGANCQIKSIVKTGNLNTVTFVWTDTEGTSTESTMLVYDGAAGEQGPQGIPGQPGAPGISGSDGFSPTITVKESTAERYVLTITDASGSYDTPNLKGSGGGGGASALSDLTDVQLQSLADGDALIYDSSLDKWANVALGTAATKNSTNAVTSGDTDLVESGAVYTAIDNARGDVTESQYSAIATILS